MRFRIFKYVLIKLSGYFSVRLFFVLLSVTIFQLTSISAIAQCAIDANPAVLQTFGSGTSDFANANPEDYNFTTSYNQESGTFNDAPQDGLFSFVNAVPDPWNVWHGGATDHTGDPNGYMMLVNADYTPGEFYRDTIHQLCPGIEYEFFSWIANVDLGSLNGRIRPDVRFEIRNAANGNLIADYETGDIPAYNDLTWKKYALSFNTSAQDVVLLLINNNPGGGGNDLVLDDIGFTPCLPVYAAAGPDSLCEGEDFTFDVQSGNGYSNPEYQWQKKESGTWTDIAGENSDVFSKTNIASADSGWYRVIIAENNNINSMLCRSVDSLHLSLKTNSISDPGSIADDQIICYNTVPDPFTNAGDAVSLLPKTYSWEKSEDLTNWSTLTGSSGNYTETANLTEETYYRRKVTTSCTSAYSDTITVEILEDVDPGSIADDQFICEGSQPDVFTETATATGGDEDYGYQWQISEDGTNWSEITNATSETYQSPQISKDTWFRRRVNDGQCATVVTEDVTIQNRVRYTNVVKLTYQDATIPVAIDIEQCQYQEEEILQASGSNLSWYTVPTGGTALATVPVYSTDTPDSLTYFVSQTVSGCESLRDTLSIKIFTKPVLTVKDTAICAGNTARLNFETSGATGDFTYQWLSNTTLDVVDQANVIAEPELTTSYTLYVEDSASCRDTATLTVTIHDNPEVSMADVDLCAENDTLLTAVVTGGNGNINYSWSPAVNIISTTDNKARVKPAATTAYKVVVEDENACKDSVSASVILFSKPDLSANNITACKGETVALDFQTNNANGSLQYTWDPENNLNIQSETNVDVFVNTDFTYTLYVEDSQGCKDTTTIEVNTHPGINASLSSEEICEGEDVTLVASASGGTGTFSYNWLSAAGIESISDNQATVKPETTTEYSVVISDANSCKDTVEAIVTINPVPQLNIVGGDICSGNPIELKSTVTAYTGSLNYTWSPATGLNNTGSAHVISNTGSSITYTLLVTDSKNCSNSATTTVGVTNTPVAQILQTDTVICKGNEILFSALEDASENYTYKWFWENSTGEKVEVSDQNNTELKEAGIYTVEVRNNGFCPVISDPVLVEVEEIQVEAFSSEKEIYEDELVNLYASGSGNIVNYTWTTPEGLKPRESFTTPLFETYTFQVEAKGKRCIAQDTVSVRVLPSILIPNGFSPDYDGKNDAWFIKGLSEFPDAELTIYNRWGSIVYNYSSGYNHPWEGTNTKGEMLPLGTYYYVINVKDKKGQIFKGSVTIIN